MKIFIVLLSLFLVSCMTVPKLPVKDKRIAIITDNNEKNSLCHEHTGITIFNNFEAEYALPTDISLIINQGYIDGVRMSGNSPIEITSHPSITQLMNFDGWEHYYLTDEGKEFLNKISKDLNLDYAVIEWPSKENPCAVHLYTRSAYGSIQTILSSSWTTEVFDLKTLKSVGITYLGSDHEILRGTTPPKFAKKITPEELAIYTKDSAKAPRGAMLQFFE